jgi:hypothetical protein
MGKLLSPVNCGWERQTYRPDEVSATSNILAIMICLTHNHPTDAPT